MAGKYEAGALPFRDMDELLHWCARRYPVAYQRSTQPWRVVSSAYLMNMSLDVVWGMLRRGNIVRAWPRDRAGRSWPRVASTWRVMRPSWCDGNCWTRAVDKPPRGGWDGCEHTACWTDPTYQAWVEAGQPDPQLWRGEQLDIFPTTGGDNGEA
jgi:hypothetical protein